MYLSIFQKKCCFYFAYKPNVNQFKNFQQQKFKNEYAFFIQLFNSEATPALIYLFGISLSRYLLLPVYTYHPGNLSKLMYIPLHHCFKCQCDSSFYKCTLLYLNIHLDMCSPLVFSFMLSVFPPWQLKYF